ncbi:MAG TPA: NAD(P)/FAD-dependent oxidoreductase, partial [Actinomycetota bacterium]|nr:NAD(P)/FAD-dependent oxidoreductase [Actinomycetota bacterium]
TGAADRLPEIAGASERWGRDLLHCPYCHGWEVRDQPVGVLATRPGSVRFALLVRQWSSDVVFFDHLYESTSTERLELKACGVEIVEGEVGGLVVEADRLAGVALKDGRVIPRSAVFVRPDNRPHLDALFGLRCALDRDGFVMVDDEGRTSARGVWAAGNVVDPRASLIASAGAGSTAAMSINAELVDEDVEAALTPVR